LGDGLLGEEGGLLRIGLGRGQGAEGGGGVLRFGQGRPVHGGGAGGDLGGGPGDAQGTLAVF